MGRWGEGGGGYKAKNRAGMGVLSPYNEEFDSNLCLTITAIPQTFCPALQRPLMSNAVSPLIITTW